MTELSIIVPVYKVEAYLERCINSILAQTYKNFEVILVDDGSPDKSGELCDRFAELDSRIKVIHKKNGGLSSARNQGIRAAEGKYIGFVDSDDWITNDMFEYLINLIKKYEADIASVSYILANEYTLINDKEIKVNVYNRNEALKYYMKEGMSNRIADYPVWIKVYKKELFDDIEFPEGQLYEDIATNFKLIQKTNRYVKSNKVCYFYYQDGTSITRSGFKMKDKDLFDVSDEVVYLAKLEGNEELLNLALLKRARANFSLLAKIAVYGFYDENEFDKKLVCELTSKLREDYKFLIKSMMPISRKFIMSILCIDYRIIRIPLKIRSKIRNSRM